MSNEHGPQLVLETITNDSNSKLIKGIGSVALLLDARINAEENLSVVTTERDIEVAAINDKYGQRITTLKSADEKSQNKIHEAHERITKKTIEEFKSGEITDEEVIYVTGLLSKTGDERYGTRDSFDFVRAADYLSTFKQLQPGVRVLRCRYSDTFGRKVVPRYSINFVSGGVLAEKPKLSNIGPYHLSPKIDFSFDDGRKVTEDWSRQRVVGEDVNTLVEEWIEENSFSDGEFHRGEIPEILDELKILEPLKLEIPALITMKTIVLGRAKGCMATDPNLLIEYLDAIRTVGGHNSFIECIGAIVNSREFVDKTKLTEEVAKAMTPNYEQLSKAAMYHALAGASLILDEVDKQTS